MNTTAYAAPWSRPQALAATILLLVLTAPVWASSRSFTAQKPADPAGSVEVINVEGTIEISGWDQPTVDVTGTIGSKVERVDVTSNANHTTVRVVLPSGNNWGSDGDSSAHLKIREDIRNDKYPDAASKKGPGRRPKGETFESYGTRAVTDWAAQRKNKKDAEGMKRIIPNYCNAINKLPI